MRRRTISDASPAGVRACACVRVCVSVRVPVCVCLRACMWRSGGHAAHAAGGLDQFQFFGLVEVLNRKYARYNGSGEVVRRKPRRGCVRLPPEGGGGCWPLSGAEVVPRRCRIWLANRAARMFTVALPIVTDVVRACLWWWRGPRRTLTRGRVCVWGCVCVCVFGVFARRSWVSMASHRARCMPSRWSCCGLLWQSERLRARLARGGIAAGAHASSSSRTQVHRAAPAAASGGLLPTRAAARGHRAARCVCMCTCLRVCAIWARDRGPATARRAAAAPHGRARPRAGSAFLLWLATLVPGVAAVLHMREVPCSGAAAATPPGA